MIKQRRRRVLGLSVSIETTPLLAGLFLSVTYGSELVSSERYVTLSRDSITPLLDNYVTVLRLS